MKSWLFFLYHPTGKLYIRFKLRYIQQHDLDLFERLLVVRQPAEANFVLQLQICLTCIYFFCSHRLLELLHVWMLCYIFLSRSFPKLSRGYMLCIPKTLSWFLILDNRNPQRNISLPQNHVFALLAHATSCLNTVKTWVPFLQTQQRPVRSCLLSNDLYQSGSRRYSASSSISPRPELISPRHGTATGWALRWCDRTPAGVAGNYEIDN